MLRAIIFDFDGVLVLSDKPQFKIIQNVASKYNVKIGDRLFNKIVGKATRPFLEEILPKKEEHLINKIIIDYEKEFKGNITKHVKPISFSVNFIKSYHGPLLFALASMSPHSSIKELTEYFDIYSKFTAIVTEDEVTNHKPDPEIYLKALKKAGVSSDEAIAVEDSIIGAQAALKAGIKCFILLNGFNNKVEFSKLAVAGFINSKKDFDQLINHPT